MSKVHRSLFRYQSQADDQAFLRKRIKEIAAVRVRYGYLRIHVLMRREVWQVNHKRVYRLYCQEGLHLRYKRPRSHVSAAHRVERPLAIRPNESWSMDFVSDALFDGRRLRALTVIDNFTREILAIEVDQGITGKQVVAVLEKVSRPRGLPERIFLDNGPEFVSKALDLWAYEYGVTLDFSRPGKPTDNAMIESFNGRFRDECLNVNWFLSLEDAKSKIEAWRQDYNGSRPHTSLGDQTPREFARCHLAKLPDGGSSKRPNPHRLAGYHAINDMVGDEPDSWKSVFKAKDIKAVPVMRAITELPKVVDLYIAHTKKCLTHFK